MAAIRVDDALKSRIAKLKKSLSYGDYLEKVVTYFEVTGVNPDTQIVLPEEAVKKSANRVIEVIRGIEKKQNAYLEFIREMLVGAQHSSLQTSTTASLFNDDEYIKVAEAQELIDKYHALEAAYAKLSDENKHLKVKAVVEQQKAPISGGDSIAKLVAQDLRSKFEVDRFDPQYLRIDKYLIEQALKRIEENA